MWPQHLRPSRLHVESRWKCEYSTHPEPKMQHWPLNNAKRLLTGDTEAAAGSAGCGDIPSLQAGRFPSLSRYFLCQQHLRPTERQVARARLLARIRDAVLTDGVSHLSSTGAWGWAGGMRRQSGVPVFIFAMCASWGLISCEQHKKYFRMI